MMKKSEQLLNNMFSPVPIKQEYSNLEEPNQNAPNLLQTHSDYPLFTNQDVEYMYRQLPQFLSQTNHLTEALASKNDVPHHPAMFQQPAERPYESALFQTNVESDVHSVVEGITQVQGPSPMVPSAAPLARLPAKPNGPGRPPKTVATAAPKKLKCQCEICFKEFGHKSNLFIHMRTHNGERPYKCSQCDKCFTHSGNLAIHMRTHSGERPYACQICGKMFSHSGNLSTHLRTHSGVKPYKCSVCNKEFRHSGNLSIHERIHSGIKPFQCKICSKEFYHSGNLTTHMKKHPRVVDADDEQDKVKNEDKEAKESGPFVASGS